MRLRRAASGREALAAWLARRARASASRFLALEESLLAGRFARYAGRRLMAFGLARATATFVHLVELGWLFEIFSAKPFVASIALQNVTLVADAFFWGALEGYRRRARALGPTSDTAALGTRWLTLASWAALGAIVLPLAVAVLRSRESPILHAYAVVCGVRLAADVVLRTWYSGVFAFHRVHRPIWSTVLGPILVIGVTWALWERAAGWSFVIALGVSVAVSRGLLFLFTDRAYRRFRVPRPRLRLFSRGALCIVDRDALLAGGANLSTRLGGVVLLAALIPSLTTLEGPDDEPVLEPFAYALHLAAPFILVASQWAFAFYHDWKRLEDDAAARLGVVLERRLVVTAVVVGVACALLAAALVLLHVPSQDAWPILASLLAATTGLSVWTALQIRRFSHGEHVRQVASAIALVLVVASALASEEIGPVMFYAALALGPWLAIATSALLGRRAAAPSGELASIATFLRALAGTAEDDVALWEAVVDGRPADVAARIVERLGIRGALVRDGVRLVWFERAPTTTRRGWLACAGGRLRTLARVELPRGVPRTAETTRGIIVPPHGRRDLDALAAEHARLFPEGFVIRVGGSPPPTFLALAPHARQAIWRDALRFRFGARGRSGFSVTCAPRDGAPEAVFVVAKPVDEERLSTWRATLAAGSHRIGAPGSVKLGREGGIVAS